MEFKRPCWLSKALPLVLAITLVTSSFGTAFATEANSIQGSGSEVSTSNENNTSVGNQASNSEKNSLADDESVNSLVLESSDDAYASSLVKAIPADSVTITSPDQLTPFFPDAYFRAVVFKAVKNGQDRAEGATVEEALANFVGDIPAKGKGVSNITGIEKLRRANKVDLTKNNISDFSHLVKQVAGTSSAGQQYYGLTPDEYDTLLNEGYDREAGTNVLWVFDANPISLLPDNFGGRLVIKQPGTASYTYPEDLATTYTYLRNGTDSISGQMNIAKAFVVQGPTQTPVGIGSVSWNSHNEPNAVPFDVVWTKGNNETAGFSNLKKSGHAYLAVGTEEDLHYWTDDELGTSTPGSQSMKYYLTPRFWVYDKVTINGVAKGSATLLKVDSVTKAPLAGATFSLFKKDGTLVKSGLITAADGKITVPNLAIGSYYFQETAAPQDYVVNAEKIALEVQASEVTLHGGVTEVNTEGGKITAQDHEVFIAGPDKDEKSPDISLTQGMTPVRSVKVKYSLLEIIGSDTPVPAERAFATAQEAQDNINEEKNANRILGSVSIEVEYDAASSGSAAAVVTAENKKVSYIDIPVTKHWVDNPDWQGTKRSDITVRLYRDGLEIDSATLQGGLPSPSGDDKIPVTTFKDLPTCDAMGKDYVYTIKEDEVTSPTTIGVPYTTTYSEDGKGGFVVKNEWVQGSYFNLIGQKAWSDYTPSTRPETVQIILKRDGELFSTITTNAALQWKYSFNNLPKWKEKDKVLYTYTLEEASVSDYTSFEPVTVPLEGDTPDASTITIASKDTTNTFNNNIVKVDGEKVWKGDQASDRPASVGITLMQNGNVFKTTTATIDSGWKYSFADLPKYAAGGKEYIYTVKETAVPAGYLTSVEGTTITNKKIPSTRVKVEKVWKDNGGFTGPWPDITIRLLQNGKEIDHATLQNGTTDYTFQNLPTTDAVGAPYAYKVTEDQVASSDGRKGYKTTIEGTAAAGFVITNTWTEEDLVNIAGKKVWEGDEQFSEKERPAFITLVLYRDGIEYAEKFVTAGARNLWEYTFTNLPKHKEGTNDKLSVYTIKEQSTPGYEVHDYPEIDLKNIQNGQTFENADITNSFVNNMAKVEGQKAWSGDALADRPSSVEVVLLQNGTEIGKTATVMAPTWKYSFTNLPKYSAEGKAYVYTVKEKNVPNGYSTKVEGTTITNTKIPLISVKGTKHWVDNKGWTGDRPEATIHLLRDGVAIPPDQGGVVVLPESHTSGPDTFTYEFNNLPETDQAGKEYAYTVTEDPIKSPDDLEGYVSSIMGYNITNTWVKGELFNISGEKAWSDFEDAEGMRPGSVNMVLKQNGIEIAHASARSDNGWAYDFKLLPKWADDAKKELYVYTIEEQEVEGYESFSPVDVPTADVVDKGTVAIDSGKTTNKLINALTKIQGEKLWNDFDNAGNSRPDAIMVSVLQNGVKLEGVSATASAPEWTYSVEGLPKYYIENNTVKQYSYSVQEAVPDGYMSEIGADGTTISNTFINEIVSISLEKKWIDTGKESERPKEISVSVLQNGIELEKIKLTEANSWKASMVSLPKFDAGGEAYAYAVQEEALAGYQLTDQSWTRAADGNSWTGILTNSKVGPNDPVEPNPPTPVDPSDSKAPKPLAKSGDGLVFSAVALALAACAGAAALLMATRRKQGQPRK